MSKNGALLLNIGPKADGTVLKQDAALLLEIGRWLAVHGEAIYQTRPWKVFGEGPTAVPEGMFADTLCQEFTPEDFRFTARGQQTLYVLGLAPPRGPAVIRSLGSNLRLLTRPIESVSLLRHKDR